MAPHGAKEKKMSTHFTRKEDISRNWLVVDAKDMVVGRLCTNLAMYLMGKHKPSYTPHVDDGDYVIVINAEKVKFTGNKWDEKLYRRHTGFVPAEIIRLAVKGMLPKNKTLATRQLMKLKIYTGDKHPHAVQNPKAVKIEGRTGKVME